MTNDGWQSDEEIDKETRKKHRKNWFYYSILAVAFIAIFSLFKG